MWINKFNKKLTIIKLFICILHNPITKTHANDDKYNSDAINNQILIKQKEISKHEHRIHGMEQELKKIQHDPDIKLERNIMQEYPRIQQIRKEQQTLKDELIPNSRQQIQNMYKICDSMDRLLTNIEYGILELRQNTAKKRSILDQEFIVLPPAKRQRIDVPNDTSLTIVTASLPHHLSDSKSIVTKIPIQTKKLTKIFEPPSSNLLASQFDKVRKQTEDVKIPTNATKRLVSSKELIELPLSLIKNIINNKIVAFITVSGKDATKQKGWWISGLYGINQQKTLHNISSYKINNCGVTIGFNAELDQDLLGIAYSNISSNLKFTNIKDIGKISIISHVISLYGQKDLGKRFSLQGVFSTSHNYIINEAVGSKNRVINYNLEKILNYKIITSYNFVIMPNVSIQYNQYQGDIYNVSGDNVQNLPIIVRSQNFVTGSIGTRLIFPSYKISESAIIIPGLHSSIKKYFNKKILQHDNFTQYVLPQDHTICYNIGTNIRLQRKDIMILVECNCHLYKKHQSYQGFILLKIMC